MVDQNTPKGFRPPDLSNATPQFLADELGLVRTIQKRMKKLEGIYKEALKARWPTKDLGGDQAVPDAEVVGEKFAIDRASFIQNRLDTGKVKAILTPEQLKEVMVEIPVEQLRSRLAMGIDQAMIDLGMDWDDLEKMLHYREPGDFGGKDGEDGED